MGFEVVVDKLLDLMSKSAILVAPVVAVVRESVTVVRAVEGLLPVVVVTSSFSSVDDPYSVGERKDNFESVDVVADITIARWKISA